MPVRCSRARTPAAVAAVTILLLVLVAALLPGTADAQQAEQRRLEHARARLAQLSTEIARAEAEAKDADAALDDAEATLREIEAVVNDVAKQVEHQRAAVADAQERLDAVEAEAAALAEAFTDRIARLYKQGPELAIEMLFAAEGAEDALARTVMLQHVMQGDQIDLESLDAAEVSVAAERGRLADEQRVLEEMLAEQQELLEEVARLRETRALAAAEAREQVRTLHQEQDSLEEEQQRLETLIKHKQEEERRRRAEEQRRQQREQQRRQRQAASAPSSSTTSAPSSSGYAWPLCARVTSEYGPRWGRLHAGIDLGASTGTPIGASKAGTVIFADWQGGYGRLVLIDHGDGVVTAYAHMSKISVGAGSSVSQGQTIGLVGSTGNSTGPHLHFETRVNGSAVNPRQYLSGSPC